MKQGYLFSAPRPTDAPALLSWSAAHILGTEIRTSLLLDAGETNERLLVGRDAAGAPRCVVFRQPSYKVFLSPDRAAAGKRAANALQDGAPPPRRERCAVMVKRDAAPPPSATYPVRKMTNTELRGFYTLMAQGSRFGRATEENYVYMQRCVNRDAAAAFGVFEGGDVVSGAMICAVNDVYALIGNVFTEESRRGRGLAQAALAACEREAEARGLIPVLYCAKRMTRYYRRRGYRKVRVR